MKFLRKKVLGIPLGVLIALLVVGVAAAAFYNSLLASVSVTAQAAPAGTYSVPVCYLTGPGTVDTCVNNGDGTMTVEASELSDDSILNVQITYENTSTVNQVLSHVIPDPLPAGVASITPNRADGYVLVPSMPIDNIIAIDFGDLTPGATVSAMEIGWNFQQAP